jgi:hypothetical protein
MFVGHYGIAFALKRAEPRVSLGTLFLAVQLVDILWGGTLLLGWEHARVVPGYLAASPFEFLDYPITHSLVAGLGWGAAMALVYYSLPTTNVSHHARAALIVGLAVLSHWPLDVLMHAPDLPVAGNASARLGFGLWRSVPLTIGVELVLLAIGVALYATRHSRKHPVRPVRLAIVLIVLLAAYLSSFLGTPPANIRIIGIVAALSGLIMALLGWWADRPADVPPAEPRRARAKSAARNAA